VVQTLNSQTASGSLEGVQVVNLGHVLLGSLCQVSEAMPTTWANGPYRNEKALHNLDLDSGSSRPAAGPGGGVAAGEEGGVSGIRPCCDLGEGDVR
jgi:hypothetical protein